MKIIDAHIHTSLQRKDWQAIAKGCKVTFSLEGLRAEMKQNNVEYAISLTDTFADETPIGYKWITKQAKQNKNIVGVCGINPFKIRRNSLKIMRTLLRRKLIRGLKVYSGYYSVSPLDKRYAPFYKLAEEFDVPVIFHTGDTLSKKALLKYAHPLLLDELAVKFSNLKIIIAHCGNPWFSDAAAVAYKNKNVYVDVSGLVYQKVDRGATRQLGRQINFIANYAGWKKIIYGSDWPIVKMQPYIKMIKSTAPKKVYGDVFYKTAAKLFKL